MCRQGVPPTLNMMGHTTQVLNMMGHTTQHRKISDYRSEVSL